MAMHVVDCSKLDEVQRIINLARKNAIGLTFEDAVNWAKLGEKVSRKSWKDGTYVECQFPDENSKMTEPYFFMHTEDGRIIPWSISHDAVFAKDWFIYIDVSTESSSEEVGPIDEKYANISPPYICPDCGCFIDRRQFIATDRVAGRPLCIDCLLKIVEKNDKSTAKTFFKMGGEINELKKEVEEWKNTCNDLRRMNVLRTSDQSVLNIPRIYCGPVVMSADTCPIKVKRCDCDKRSD